MLPAKQRSLWLTLILSCFAFLQLSHAQKIAVPDTALFIRQHNDTTLTQEYDVTDLFWDILRRRQSNDTSHSKSGLTFLPSIAYNPSIGAQIGIKVVAGRVLGNEPGTVMSVAAAAASVTTKEIVVLYSNHNIFTPGNRWNIIGNWRIANMLALDYGMGIGYDPEKHHAEEEILANPDRELYLLRYNYYNVSEKVYKQVFRNLFLGAGFSMDIRQKIHDQRLGEGLTPHYVYSERNGFNADRYVANGLLFNVQYTSRDHTNRAYKGIYSDIGIRSNKTWLGSNSGSVQLMTDFRKYWSLSDRNPEHVLAFWHWGSYLLGGNLPYLELPGTGRDTYNRSGRGYTIGYFNGPLFFYSEAEYRFPITRNKFLSGVAFMNLQTASDQMGTKLFERWQPAAGAGLRILFNKTTRTNLCLDYAFGRYGAHGFFLGLNEVF